MTYQVFALKWRPQRFADVVGQEHVTRTLQNAIREGRIPHAFLFTGSRGVGKTTSARILAKALVCEHGPAVEPCNECRFCREVTAGTSLDVFEIDAASNRGIDDVRELRENVRYAPAAARFKIYVVDEVHMLTKEAFNALLKTLEEPPPHVKFVFATTEVGKVPITIQSRCQRFDFRLLNREEIAEQLRRITEAEDISVGRDALAAIAGAAEGSLRDGESLLDQVIAYCGREVREEDVAQALGLPEEKTVLEFCAGLVGRRGSECLRLLDRVAAAGLDPRAFAREALAALRNVALLQAAPDLADLIPASAETLDVLRGFASAASAGRVQSLFELLLRTESEIRDSSFPRMLLELAVIRAVRLEELDDLQALLARLEQLERGARSGLPLVREVALAAPPPPPPASPEPAAPAADPGAGAADSDAGAGLLARLVERIRGEKIVLASCLEHGRITAAGPGELEIGFAREDTFSLETWRESDNLALLRRTARELLGGKVEVRVVSLDEAAGPEEERRPRESDRKKKLRHEAIEHPAVLWAMEIFQGQIVEVKVDP